MLLLLLLLSSPSQSQLSTAHFKMRSYCVAPALMIPINHHLYSYTYNCNFPSTSSVVAKNFSTATHRSRTTDFSVRLLAIPGSDQQHPNSKLQPLQQQQKDDKCYQNSLRLLLRELSESFALPPDFLANLPKDLRLDLTDAAFDLSQGAVVEECGEEVGMLLLDLSRAWELADTDTSCNLMSKLPASKSLLDDGIKNALGKRFISAGMRFRAMGQYGKGEFQRVAKVMIETGKLLSSSPVVTPEEASKSNSRVLKFGELQMELTPLRAYTGVGIGCAFGILSWRLSQGVSSMPESSLQYANDNALLLAKSLRGAFLALCYSSTLLSAFATMGLLLLAIQLSSKENNNQE